MDDLKGIDKKLKTAQEQLREDEVSEENTESHLGSGGNAGAEFLAYVISGGIIGYALDRFFDSLPLGTILLIIVGFALGVQRANQRMQKNAE